MTDAVPTPPPANAPLADERQIPFIVYLAYLASLAVPPLAIVGLVLAYSNREAAPDWLKTHHEFQIRTFWLTLLYLFVSAVLCLLLIGFLLMAASIVLYAVRCALGLYRLIRREPYPNPETWLT